MLFVLAAVCFFFAHNAINDYMIQIITPLGGTEAQMGIAVSCAALLELPTMALIDKIIKKISVKNLLLISGIAFLIKKHWAFKKELRRKRRCRSRSHYFDRRNLIRIYHAGSCHDWRRQLLTLICAFFLTSRRKNNSLQGNPRPSVLL